MKRGDLRVGMHVSHRVSGKPLGIVKSLSNQSALARGTDPNGTPWTAHYTELIESPEES